MRDFRKGNDIAIRWHATINQGDVKLGDSDIRLILTDRTGIKKSLPFIVQTDDEGNEWLVTAYYGKDHSTLGRYRLTMWLNYGKIGEGVLDHCDVFNLVSTTCQIKNNTDSCDNLETDNVITIEDNLAVGVKGDSAYQSWLNVGFTGTEMDFLNWLRQGDGGGTGGGDYDDTLIWRELGNKQDKIVDLDSIRDNAKNAVKPSDLDLFAQKSWVTQQGFAKQTEIPLLYGYATQAWVEGKGYLTQHQSLDNYALKTEIPSQVSESTISSWGFTKNTGTYSKPSGGIPKSDLASAVQISLNNADTALQPTALNGYATRLWVTQQGFASLNDIPSLNGFATQNWVMMQGYLTEHQDISGKQDKINDLAEIRSGAGKGATAVQPAAISDMETKTNAAATYQPKGNYATEEKLTEFATRLWVTQQGYLTQHQDISNKADKMAIFESAESSISTAINAANYPKATIVKYDIISSLTLTSIDELAYEVVLIFSTGTDVTNFLTIPNGTKVVNEIKIEAGKTYAMSILGGSLVCGTINLSE